MRHTRGVDKALAPPGASPAAYPAASLAASPAADKPLDRALVWLRRDLRVDDHAALYHALRAARQVWCCFVFDTAILDPLPRSAW